MDSLRTTDFGRRALSYSLEGLKPRDEMLFKSLVRLLDHLTVQKWVFRPASPDYRVDLVVVADNCLPTLFGHDHPVKQPILSVGTGGDRDFYLSWPVQPQRLRAELNRIGSVAILHQTQDPHVPHMPHMSLAPVVASSVEFGNQLFRLKQWPPSKYLAGVGRMRLATLMTGRAISMQEMQTRSALHLSVCRAFVSDMQAAQLLVVTVDETPAPIAVLEPHQILNLPSSAVAFAKRGLFARIRAGLGIKSSRNA